MKNRNRLENLAGNINKTIDHLLGIEIVEATAEKVVLLLPVNERVHQPMGVLHGGVSCVLAESAGSIGAFLNTPEGKVALGIEINTSHLRSVRNGQITAIGTPIRIGRTIQVWNIDIFDEYNRQISKSRLTLSVMDAPPA